MLMINFADPLILLIGALLFVLVLILAKETKRSSIIAIMLFAFTMLLILHTITFLTNATLAKEDVSNLIYTMVFDLIFVLIAFISYLWIDDIEAKEKKKKSMDNSLNWFWEKIN